MKCLILSKDQNNTFLKNFLIKSNFEVEEANMIFDSENIVRDLLCSSDFQVIIIDRLGEEILKFKSDFLTSKDYFMIINDSSDLDYLVDLNDEFTFRFYFWPLNYNLILDDIKALSRVKSYMEFRNIYIKGVEFNLNKRVLKNKDKEILLKNKEFELLLYLVNNKGRVVSKTNILENVWDMNASIMTNTVDVHLSKLRKIFKVYFDKDSLIQTIPCVGYVLT